MRMNTCRNWMFPTAFVVLLGLLFPIQAVAHLVLVSRSDPSLDLFRFRAQNQMSEVRAQALSFTVDETTAFLEQVVGMGIEEGIARALTEKTEGWVTGLHLITLSAQSNADLADVSRVLPGEQQTLDYLIAEALSHQPRELQAWLLKTSILNRFCASLCEAVCASPPSGEASSIDGVEFLRWLTENNLLVVSLDHGGQWFRYHHLFQELLQSQLDNVLEVDETAGLHMRASAWFNAQGMIDDAIKHALAAGNVVAAAELVEEHRHAQHDADRWYVVEQWLAMLPQEIKQQRAGLLLAQAWTYFVHFRQDLIPQVLEQVASLLDDETADPLYLGELDFFRGNLHYWVGEAESSVRYLEEALAQLSGREPFAENNTEVMLGLARSMAGQKDQAIQGINDRIGGADTLPGTILTYRIGGLAFIHLLAGELLQARAQGERLQTVAGQAHIPNSEAWSSYLQGCSQLHTGNFDDAVFHFAAAAQHRYVLDTGALLDAHAGIALSYQLMQQDDAAVQAMKRLIELACEVGDPYCLSVAHSCQARLALLRGDLASATQWALSANESSAPSSLFLWLEVPAITQARVLIAVGSEGNLEKASELLQEIRHQSEACHFINQLIEVAVLQSLSLGRQRRNKRALVVLEEAVTLAAPGGWIRPFLEAGQPIADLLVQLQEQGLAGELAMYLDQILSIFPAVADPGRQGGLIEPPTERELQVLRLLATELNANEIAEQLVVSVATVRAHTRSVYSKLDVHSRYEAVQQAQKLGLI